MPAPSTVDQFTTVCLKSGLVTENQLGVLRTEAPTNPSAAAKSLVRVGAITKFQAAQLLLGKYKGLRFDRLKILDRIGSGGMGTVFLCEHLGLRKNVAVKMLPPDQASDIGTRERFFREARAAAALDHPNIVRVFDMNHSGGVHYIVMEYVEGVDLQTVLNRHGALPHGRACAYVAQVAIGLQHAHEKGMIHRDIKPANLLVDNSGTVKILDMGLACFPKDKSDNLTARYDKGAILGTADFMAPEQVLSSSTVDIRADIYSLGMTLYTLINGKPPFGGSGAQKMVGQQTVVAPSLSTIGRKVPAKLAAIVDKMIAKNPDDRHQTPAEVADALTPWMDNESVAIETGPADSKSPTTATRARSRILPPPPPKSRRNLYLLIGVAGFVVIAGAAGIYAATRGGDKPPVSVAETKTEPVAITPVATPTPTPTPTPPPEKPPVPPPFQTTTVTILDANNCPEGSVSVRAGGKAESGKLLPPGWGVLAWKAGSEATFAVENFDGSKVISVTNTAGDPSAQLLSHSGSPVAKLKARRGYRLSVEYATKLLGAKWTGGIDVRFGDLNKPGSITGAMPATGGKIRTSSVTFRAPIDAPLTVFFSLFSPAGEDTLMIRTVTLSEIAPPTRDPLDDDFTTAADAVRKINNGETFESSGELPVGYHAQNADSSGVGEFGVSLVGDRKALTLRGLTGGRAAVLVHSPRFAADRTRECRADLEYRADAMAGARLKLDDGTGRSRWIADLPPTGGEWRKISVPFWPMTTFATARLELHNNGAGKENLLAVSRLTVKDLGVNVPTDNRPVIQLKPAPKSEVKIRVVGRTTVEQKTGELPDGYQFQNWDPSTASELVIGEFEGSPAVRITNQTGKSTAMLFTPFVPNTAEEYELRLEYQAPAAPTAGSIRLVIKGAEVPRTIGELPQTNGGWKELRTRFRPGPGEQFRLDVHHLTSGDDKPLLIRNLTVKPS